MVRDPWHEAAKKRVIHKFGNNYEIKAPFNLPKQNRPESLYQPDVCVFCKLSNELRYIIELETRNIRKSIMGAAILAQICSKAIKRKFVN